MKRERSAPPPQRKHARVPDYEVGYGKPPKHGEFKKGRSGNPAGRPKDRRNIKTVLVEVLQERVQMRQGDRIRTVPYSEALFRKIVSSALQGDPKAVAAMISLIRLSEGLPEQSDPRLAQQLTEEDQNLIANFLERHRTGLPASSTEPILPKRSRT